MGILDGNSMWEFSVQQVNSCTQSCLGCGGGDTVYAYEYLMDIPLGNRVGLGSAAFAPYVQSMYETCLGPRCTEACSDLSVEKLVTQSSLTGYFAQVDDYTFG